jgi:hypothetical protein
MFSETPSAYVISNSFNDSASISHCTSRDRMITNREMEETWKEEALV